MQELDRLQKKSLPILGGINSVKNYSCLSMGGAGFLLREIAQPIATRRTKATIYEATCELLYFTMTGAIIKLTRLTTLIIGFSAGPAVSFNGSPTVSPTTLALCRSEPLPVFATRSRGSSSISFFALSHAPPAVGLYPG